MKVLQTAAPTFGVPDQKYRKFEKSCPLTDHLLVSGPLPSALAWDQIARLRGAAELIYRQTIVTDALSD